MKKEIAGEGYFFDLAPHSLDILDFLLGDIEEVKSFATNRGKLYEVKDTFSTVLLFKSGITGSMQYCFVSPKTAEEESVQIIGTKGNIRFGIFSFDPIRVAVDGVDPVSYDFPKPLHVQQPLIETIVNELTGTGLCPSTAESGARTTRILDLIVRQGR